MLFPFRLYKISVRALALYYKRVGVASRAKAIGQDHTIPPFLFDFSLSLSLSLFTPLGDVRRVLM
jgi:hypothetical protein